MVITHQKFNQKADRASTRPAIHSKHLNISIRAIFGEPNRSEHKSSKKAIDNFIGSWNISAIDMLAIDKLSTGEIIQKTVRHIHSNAMRATDWFVGIRTMPRLHPYDDGELAMSTTCWIDLQAESPEGARFALRRLHELAKAKLHEGDLSPNGHHVFAYALNRN